MANLSKEERTNRATSIIFECQSEMSVAQLEKLASAALDILYPKKTYEPGFYKFSFEKKD